LAAYGLDHRTAFSFRYLDGICALRDLAFARSLPLWKVFPSDWYHELILLADKRTKVLCQNTGLSLFVARIWARGGEKGVQVLFLGIGVVFGVAGSIVLILGRAPRVHHESFG
jgi:hypothetical protein